MSKIYGPHPTNHYMHQVIYGQPVTGATAPVEVWDGLVWRNPTTGLYTMYLDGHWWPMQIQVDWNITSDTDPRFIKNKPSTGQPLGNINSKGYLGVVGNLALYTSPVEETEGLIIAGLLPVAAGERETPPLI